MAQNKPGSTLDLKEACIAEATSIIEEQGVENLSLREVARRLGVSHQAPYKHFPSRDHILAEVLSRAYVDFAEYLEARPRSADPDLDLGAMGVAYLQYAKEHPLQYRLMFGTPLPAPAEHPDMLADARHAFSLLREGIRRLHRSLGIAGAAERNEHDALFVLSVLHGLTSLMQSDVAETFELADTAVDTAADEILKRVGVVLHSELNKLEPK